MCPDIPYFERPERGILESSDADMPEGPFSPPEGNRGEEAPEETEEAAFTVDMNMYPLGDLDSLLRSRDLPRDLVE